MNRRDFMKSSVAVTGFLLAGPAISLGADREAAMSSRIFVAGGDASEAVRAVLSEAGGMQAFVKKGDKVLIKPNFSFSNAPEAATTTSPELVKEVVMMCKEAGAKRVTVTDHTIRVARTSLERTGMKAALDGIDDVKLRAPDKKSAFKTTGIERGKSLKSTDIAKDYLDADVYINIPVAKNHSASTVSFGLKNQMGLIYDRWAFHSKYDLHQAIADLATVIKPALTILDATRCLVTNGPAGPGDVVKLGRVMCSTDTVALDAYATTLLDWGGRTLKPEDIGYIKYAAEHGLGEIDLSKVEIVEAAPVKTG
jgi:uncharacterized protein (DUF362 family)